MAAIEFESRNQIKTTKLLVEEKLIKKRLKFDNGGIKLFGY